jgi:hypothetical protein
LIEKPETVKPLEEHRGKLLDIDLGNEFLDITPNSRGNNKMKGRKYLQVKALISKYIRRSYNSITKN